MLLVASGLAIVVFAMPGPLGLLFYFALVMPFSIASGMAIHSLTYKGLMLIGGVQCVAIGWCVAQVAAGFRGVYGMELQPSDFIEIVVVAVVAMVPLVVAQCAWLYTLKRWGQAKDRLCLK